MNVEMASVFRLLCLILALLWNVRLGRHAKMDNASQMLTTVQLWLAGKGTTVKMVNAFLKWDFVESSSALKVTPAKVDSALSNSKTHAQQSDAPRDMSAKAVTVSRTLKVNA